MVHVQTSMYISRPKYTRQSPDCPFVIFSHIALPLAHCSTPYSSASFAQYCVVAPHSFLVDSAHLHYHRQPPPRVLPSDHTSLPIVRPLPAISSESQQECEGSTRGVWGCARGERWCVRGTQGSVRERKGAWGNAREREGTQGSVRERKGAWGNAREREGTQGSVRERKGAWGNAREHRGAQGSAGPHAVWLLWILLDRLVLTLLLHTKIKCWIVTELLCLEDLEIELLYNFNKLSVQFFESLISEPLNVLTLWLWDNLGQNLDQPFDQCGPTILLC